VALAYSIKDRSAFGDLAVRIVDITLDAAYAAGGYLLDVQQMGFGKNGTIVHVDTGVVGGFLTEYVPATGRLIVRDVSGGVGAATPEVANNLAGLNGLVLRVKTMGKGHG
jgi:hypothetical protein